MKLKEKVSELRGIPVVAYEEGLQLGKVLDIFIEKQANQIKGISFKTGRLRLESESFVSIENISKMGKNVVIISSETAATSLPKEFEGSSLKTLKGFKITTHDGKHLGEFSDLNVTMEDGKISEILLSGNKILDINVEDITIGADVIMVPADYAARIKEIEKKQSGLLTRMFATAIVSDTVKDTVKETVEKVGETVKETFEKVEEKVERVLRKSKSETESLEGKPEQKESGIEKLKVLPGKTDYEEKSDDKRIMEK